MKFVVNVVTSEFTITEKSVFKYGKFGRISVIHFGVFLRDSVLKKIFFKSDKSIGYGKWLKLTLLEAYLGEQMLEMLLSFSSYQEDQESELYSGIASFGYKTSDLEDFIAATLINKWLCRHITELLHVKFLKHYDLLRCHPATEHSDIQYEINPQKVYLLTELKISYNTIWVTLNLIVDVLVYVFSGSLVAALTTGAFVEFIRRFKF